MRLGYRPAGPGMEDENESFNEAEAHAPRILPPARFICRLKVCFNEAEAHAPRIPSRRDHKARRARASMRPRRMRLGYADIVASQHTPSSMLQ